MNPEVQAVNRSRHLQADGPGLRRLVAALRGAVQQDLIPGPASGTLGIVFLDDPEIAALHQRYFDDPSTTDVITFPSGGDEPEWAGEICLGVVTAHREANRRQIPFARELGLYLVHGWLHLGGLDDRTPPGRRQMRVAEKQAFAALGPNFRWPHWRWRP